MSKLRRAPAHLDGRTREAKLARDTRAALVAHVGGEPSATQAAIIEQLVQLRLRLAVMDRKFVEAGSQTEHDSRVYLAWANSYTRLLRQIGIKGAAPVKPTLREYIARGPAAASDQSASHRPVAA